MSPEGGPDFGDYLSARFSLPLTRTFCPRGFPLELATNSDAVIAAAVQSWGQDRLEFDGSPVRLHVLVEPGGGGAVSPPVYRLQRGLVSIVSDREHHGCCDLDSRFGWCQLSAAAVADSAWFRWHFLEAIAYMLLCSQDVVLVHAACVAQDGRGLLLCGPSGAGKSTLSFACARAGWTYLTDDATMLLQGKAERDAVGGSRHFHLRPEAAALFPEIPGASVNVRPNGKRTLYVPVKMVPGVVAASRCVIAGLVFLDRAPRGKAGVRILDSADALERLMREMPDYGGAVRDRHEQTLRKLVEVPVYELRYGTLEEALELIPRPSILRES